MNYAVCHGLHLWGNASEQKHYVSWERPLCSYYTTLTSQQPALIWSVPVSSNPYRDMSNLLEASHRRCAFRAELSQWDFSLGKLILLLTDSLKCDHQSTLRSVSISCTQPLWSKLIVLTFDKHSVAGNMSIKLPIFVFNVHTSPSNVCSRF